MRCSAAPEPTDHSGLRARENQAVVILPAEEFERLIQRTRQPQSLVRFFSESPLAKAKIDSQRAPDKGRTVDL